MREREEKVNVYIKGTNKSNDKREERRKEKEKKKKGIKQRRGGRGKNINHNG